MYTVLLFIAFYLIKFSLSKMLFNQSEELLGTIMDSVGLLPNRVVYIIDGGEAVLGQLPHMVSLQIGGKHICGGSLVDMSTIVTAAHCLYKVPEPLHYVAVVGIVKLDDNALTRQSSQVVWALPHKDFYEGFWQSDIALLKVRDHFIETPYVKPIRLPPQGYEPSGFGRVAGWGALKEGQQASNKLMETMLTIYTRDKCRYFYGDEIDGTVFCAGPLLRHEDTCQGDSGGPLMCSDYLCGVIAAGIGCGKVDEAGIYTKVSRFTDWITKFFGTSVFVIENYNP